jgi:hypothetical protein
MATVAEEKERTTQRIFNFGAGPAVLPDDHRRDPLPYHRLRARIIGQRAVRM